MALGGCLATDNLLGVDYIDALNWPFLIWDLNTLPILKFSEIKGFLDCGSEDDSILSYG